MRAVFIDCTPELARVISRERLTVPASLRVHESNPSPAEMVELCRDAEIILVEHTVIPTAVLDACPRVRAVVFMGTGAGTYLDLNDTAARGIEVRTTPGYGDRAVAEHAFALMFAAARNLAVMDRSIRAGRWSPVGGLQLAGQKLAVIGLGGIGTCLADMARSIGMEVAGWNRSPRPHLNFVPDLDSALKGASVVSVHLSLNAQTAGLLDRGRLALPKSGFILVNTARAGIIDEEALFDLLETGQIGHAALDVFPDEPLPDGSPYKRLERATLSAHAAYMTDAAYAELWRLTLKAFAELCGSLEKGRLENSIKD